MSQVGRIGGHLLDPNLERQGIDLAFKNTNFDATPILYLDVTNNRIGVKTDSPQYDLDIRTDVSTTNAEATSQARLDNVLINAPSTFSTITGPLNINLGSPNPPQTSITAQFKPASINGQYLQPGALTDVNSDGYIEYDDLRPNEFGFSDLTGGNYGIFPFSNVGKFYSAFPASFNTAFTVDGSDTLYINQPDGTPIIGFTINGNSSHWIPETSGGYANGIYGFMYFEYNLIDSPEVVYPASIASMPRTTTADYTARRAAATAIINANLVAGNDYLLTKGPYVDPSDQLFFQRLQTDNLDISDNFIQGKSTDDSITLDTSGTGTINVHANTNMTGNLAATGDINLDGNVTLAGNVIVGDSSFSTVVINPDLTQDIVPQTDNTLSFGQDERDSSPRRFSELHTPDNLTNTNNVRPMGALISNQLSFRGETGDQILETPTITSTQSNEDTMLVSATGDYYVDGTKIETDNIHNTGNDPFSFGNTGIGYLRFMGDSAFKMPAGTDAQRPALPEIGDTRWNTDLQIMECFAGIVEAVTVTGTFSGLADAADILSGTTTTNSVYGSGFSCRMNLLAGSLTVVQFLSQGIGYQQGDQISIPGTRLPGGSSPANDVTLTVGAQTSDGYAVATGGGAEISESLMEDLGDVYSLILG